MLASAVRFVASSRPIKNRCDVCRRLVKFDLSWTSAEPIRQFGSTCSRSLTFSDLTLHGRWQACDSFVRFESIGPHYRIVKLTTTIFPIILRRIIGSVLAVTAAALRDEGELGVLPLYCFRSWPSIFRNSPAFSFDGLPSLNNLFRKILLKKITARRNYFHPWVFTLLPRCFRRAAGKGRETPFLLHSPCRPTRDGRGVSCIAASGRKTHWFYQRTGAFRPCICPRSI
jgi:hypothetical protein